MVGIILALAAYFVFSQPDIEGDGGHCSHSGASGKLSSDSGSRSANSEANGYRSDWTLVEHV